LLTHCVCVVLLFTHITGSIDFGELPLLKLGVEDERVTLNEYESLGEQVFALSAAHTYSLTLSCSLSLPRTPTHSLSHARSLCRAHLLTQPTHSLTYAAHGEQSRQLISELMLLLNSWVAQVLVQHFPSSAPLRVQGTPSASRLGHLVKWCDLHGIDAGTGDSRSLQVCQRRQEYSLIHERISRPKTDARSPEAARDGC